MVWIVAPMIWQAIGVASLFYFNGDQICRLPLAQMSLNIFIGSILGPFLWLQPRD